MRNLRSTLTSCRLLSTSQLMKSTFFNSFCSWCFNLRTIFTPFINRIWYIYSTHSFTCSLEWKPEARDLLLRSQIIVDRPVKVSCSATYLSLVSNLSADMLSCHLNISIHGALFIPLNIFLRYPYCFLSPYTVCVTCHNNQNQTSIPLSIINGTFVD